jgi:hypothetical protein
MNFSEILAYYRRDDVKSALLELSHGREVVGVFRNGDYSTRPNTLAYSQDIDAMVKSGALEFHASIERWSNPMAIRADNYGSLRSGWDLILDIDCKDFGQGKVGTGVILDALRSHDIRNISLKFTGGSGWHIGVPWEAIPKDMEYRKTVKLYPDIARSVCAYLKEFVSGRLEEALLRKWSPEQLAQDSGVPLGKLLSEDSIDPWKLIEIDPVLISPRHLFRMPYSLNRKSFLVSLPVKPEGISGFEKSQAAADRVHAKLRFLEDSEEDEAEVLFTEALDWANKRLKRTVERGVIRKADQPLQAEMFPPCVKDIVNGLEDGRKRSVFILINFLSSSGWSHKAVGKFISEWNLRNRPPLDGNYVKSQLKYAERREKPVAPPNCKNPAYYLGFGVCKPDDHCRTIKNPVSYASRLVPKRKKRRGTKK